MKTLSNVQEQRVIKAAEQVVDLVNSGSAPNDALYKVAMAESLPPEFVKRLAEVFNVSRTLHHFKTAKLEQRADEFPLADASDVLSRMYPTKPVTKAASVVHDVWFTPPPDFTRPALTKEALAPVEVPPSYTASNIEMLLKRANNYIARLTRDAAVVKTDEDYAKEMVRRSVVKAAAYFRSLSHTPFDRVETDAVARWGAIANPLMDAVYLACRGDQFGEKRGSVSATERLVDEEIAPYDSIAEAINWAKSAVKAAVEHQSIVSELQDFRRELDERVKKLAGLKKSKVPFPFDGIKQAAGVLPALASGTFVGSKLQEMYRDEDTPDAFEARVNRAIDPDQELQLRAIRAKATLSDLMNNDPVISTYPSGKVMLAFNEISDLTPRVADQPGLLRDLLSRRLEMGRTDPLEAEQVLSAETALRRFEPGSPS